MDLIDLKLLSLEIHILSRQLKINLESLGFKYEDDKKAFVRAENGDKLDTVVLGRQEGQNRSTKEEEDKGVVSKSDKPNHPVNELRKTDLIAWKDEEEISDPSLKNTGCDLGNCNLGNQITKGNFAELCEEKEEKVVYKPLIEASNFNQPLTVSELKFQANYQSDRHSFAPKLPLYSYIGNFSGEMMHQMLNPESYWVDFYPKCRGFSLAHKVFDESPEPKCVWKSVYANSCDVHFAGYAHKPPKPPDYTNCCVDWYTLYESPKPPDHMVYATTYTKRLIYFSHGSLFVLIYYLSQEVQFDMGDHEMNLLVFKIQGFYNYSLAQQSSWARYVNFLLKWWDNIDAIHGKFVWVPLLLKTLMEKNDNHDQEEGVVNLTMVGVTCIVLDTRLVGGVKVSLVNPYVHHKILNMIWRPREVAARASLEGQTVKKLSSMVFSILLNFIIDKGFHLHYGETSCQIGSAYELRRCIKRIRNLDLSLPVLVNGEPLILILASSYKVDGIHVGKWLCYGDIAGNRDTMKVRISLAYHLKGHVFASAVVKVVTTVFKAILLVLDTLNLATSHIQNDMSVDALGLGSHMQNDMTVIVLVLGAGLFLIHYYVQKLNEIKEISGNEGLYALKIISDAVRVVLTEPPTWEQLGWCTSWPDSYKLYGQEYELFLLCCVRQVSLVMSCPKIKSDSVVETRVWEVYTYELGNHKITNRLLPTTRKEEFKVISIKILMVHVADLGRFNGFAERIFFILQGSASRNDLENISRE